MQMSAIHPESRALLNSWRALNGLDGPNEQAEARSRDAAGLIERLFMVQRVDNGVFVFKTMGSELKSWVGRDLRDQEIGSIFHGPDRLLIRALLDSAMLAPGPAVAKLLAFGAAASHRAEVELILLPLLERGQSERALGLFQPITQRSDPTRPAIRFSLTALMPPEPAAPARPALRVVSSQG